MAKLEHSTIVPTHPHKISQMLKKNVVRGLKTGTDLPAGRIYQLADAESYASWLADTLS